MGSFHNSLTLLSAEMLGRSFGGGVLELVPSEVAALLLPLVKIKKPDFKRLDEIVRNEGTDAERLVDETDALVAGRLRIDPDLWRLVANGRRVLRDRRLTRTSK